MVQSGNTGDLKPDVALENPENDELGYSKFSRYLAETIVSGVPEDGFVIGINGEWGSGKSTILNFTEYYLDSSNPDSVVDEDPKIIRFNPWWYSDQHGLFKRYLTELRAGLGEDEFSEAREKLSKYTAYLSSVSEIANILGVPHADNAGELSDKASELIERDENIDSLKKEISEHLSESKKEIIVVIDDIDRLNKEEIQNIFRLIKSVADFSNVTYVIAFDKTIVGDALNDFVPTREDSGGGRVLRKSGPTSHTYTTT